MDIDSTNWLKLKSGSEIRGPQTLLTDARVEKLGFAFACWLAERMGTTPDALRLAVGRDARLSGARIKAALIRGITAADSDVLDCGLCPAPALFGTLREAPVPVHAAVMISTNAADPALNGLKLLTDAGGLTGADVEALLRRAAGVEVPERLVVRHDAVAAYYRNLRRAVGSLLDDDALRPLLGMRVVVDARGSVGRDYALFLEKMGVEIEGSLYADAPGEGPIPVPDDPQALAEVGQAVLAHRADLGVRFSADGDRAAIVGPDGKPIAQNRLIALVAAMLLDTRPGATLVTDSVTSSGLTAFIAEWSGVHYRFKRGCRNVIDEAIRLNAEGIDCPLAMETSGHAAFRDNGFLDDGVYLATRVICKALNLKRDGLRLATLIYDLLEPVESAEIRLPILPFEDWTPEEEAQEIVEIILSHTLEHPEWQSAPDNREGARITFNLDGGVNNAWFQLRMSVHDPVMVLNAQSALPGGVRRILTALREVIGSTEKLDLSPLDAAIRG